MLGAKNAARSATSTARTMTADVKDGNVKTLTIADEAKIAKLVKRAIAQGGRGKN